MEEEIDFTKAAEATAENFKNLLMYLVEEIKRLKDENFELKQQLNEKK
jgi:hypothetical protein